MVYLNKNFEVITKWEYEYNIKAQNYKDKIAAREVKKDTKKYVTSAGVKLL